MVHGLSDLRDPSEALHREVVLRFHHPDDRREPPELVGLRRHQWIPFEERHDGSTFAVHEPDDPLLDPWSFLLIVRTDRIVTAHAVTVPWVTDTSRYRRILGFPSIWPAALPPSPTGGAAPGGVPGGLP